MQREGHMSEVLRILAHLRKYHNTELVLDPSNPAGKEEIRSNMPESRGIGFVIMAKIDAAHAGDTITRQSRAGFT
eukprot:13034798-Ditylum_brightwellii.AAC.1